MLRLHRHRAILTLLLLLHEPAEGSEKHGRGECHGSMGWRVGYCPNSGYFCCIAASEAMGQQLPNALRNRSQEVGRPARCNPFPCDPGCDRLSIKRLREMTDATVGAHLERRT